MERKVHAVPFFYIIIGIRLIDEKCYIWSKRRLYLVEHIW